MASARGRLDFWGAIQYRLIRPPYDDSAAYEKNALCSTSTVFLN